MTQLLSWSDEEKKGTPQTHCLQSELGSLTVIESFHSFSEDLNVAKPRASSSMERSVQPH